MGWITYYKLLEKYQGNFSKTTKVEKDFAYRDNPNNPEAALLLAKKKYHSKEYEKTRGRHN